MDNQEEEEAQTVTLEGHAFHPSELSIKVGTKVNWLNNDSDEHTVVSLSDGAMFESEPFGQGGRYTYTFDKPGEYEYYCSIHPSMRGKITVEE